jgi:hypothetical protein
MKIRYETRLKIFFHSYGPVLLSASGLALSFLFSAADGFIILFGSFITIALFHFLFSRRKYLTGIRIDREYYTLYYLDRILTDHQVDIQKNETEVVLIQSNNKWAGETDNINFFVQGKKTSFEILEKRLFEYLSEINTKR